MHRAFKPLYDFILDRPNGFSPGGLFLYFLTGLSILYEKWIGSFPFKRKRHSNLYFQSQIISIGNLTVGGTGKTPLAVWLANQLAAQKANELELCCADTDEK